MTLGEFGGGVLRRSGAVEVCCCGAVAVRLCDGGVVVLWYDVSKGKAVQRNLCDYLVGDGGGSVMAWWRW